jgi:transcriptional regulator with GAF, ATPase, and Fis domain
MHHRDDSGEVIQAWLHTIDSTLPTDVTDVINDLSNALRNNGMTVAPLSLDQISGPGLLIFCEVTPALCQFVRAFSRSGQERLLAIGLFTDAAPSPDHIWQVAQAGAADVLTCSASAGANADAVNRLAEIIVARFRHWAAIDRVLASPSVRALLIGQQPAWLVALRQVIEAAQTADAPILITGETGTGKELIARLIHQLDKQRNQHELVLLDCTTIVPDLAGSELFGHERGAFTNAHAMRAGAFEVADGGTLFLDEVGELPLSLQAQLLRVVQERSFKRLGSNAWRTANFRLVCATNRDLQAEETAGHFRRDLYYRLAHWTIRLPPLRERIGDILPLAQYFMAQARPDAPPPEIDSAVQAYLLMRPYPGNVRDLRNLAFRLAQRHIGPGPITIGDVPPDERLLAHDTADWEWRDADFEQVICRALSRNISLKEIRQAVEDVAIGAAIREESGNLQRAARKLGVTDRTLQLWRAEQRQKIAAR